MSKTRSHYSGPKIWNQDRQGQFLKRPSQGQGRGATDLGREDGGDDATKAGGGNLHWGRGATAWGREDKRRRAHGPRGQPPKRPRQG